MTDSFDAYYVWLGIPPCEQPPDHYRLLGIPPFESNLDVIENAADRQMVHLQIKESGDRTDEVTKLLSEVSKARICLLNAKKKESYDAELRSRNKTGWPGKDDTRQPVVQPPIVTTPTIRSIGLEEKSSEAVDADDSCRNRLGQFKLWYNVKPRKTFLSRIKTHYLVLYGAQQKITLPEICLVAKSRTVPLTLADGKLVCSFAAGTVVAPGKIVELTFSADERAKKFLVRLFTNDPSDADWLTLVPKRVRMAL